MSINMSKVEGMLFLHAFTKKLNNKKDPLERKPNNIHEQIIPRFLSLGNS